MQKPSVTELTKLLDKPALVKWANKLGLSGVSIDAHRTAATTEGRNLHKQMEDFMATGAAFEDAEFQARFVAFFKAKEIISFEKEVETDLFRGRLDIKYRHRGMVFISDFKLNQTRHYIENRIQLAAYRMADGCDAVSIIRYPEMAEVEVAIADFKPYERLIELLCEMHPLIKTL